MTQTRTKTFSLSIETQRKIDTLKKYLGLTSQSSVIQTAINEFYKTIEADKRMNDKYRHL